MNNISQVLIKIFEKHRIVFWYDTKQEMRQEFESLVLPGVESVEIVNNEFAIKHRILRDQNTQKFLLYRDGAQPSDLENWLLDVQLAHGTFSADQISLWMNEIGFPPTPDYFGLVQDHIEFFKAVGRREALRSRLSQEDSLNMIRTKMLAVCANGDTESRTESILEALLAELADDRDEKISLIQRCNLDAFLWSRLKAHFGYRSQTPSIKDFAINLFKSCYAISLNEESSLTQDSLVFLKRWKDSIRNQKSFEALSEDSADVLDIKKDLQNRDVRLLIELDFYKLIDQRILGDLIREVVEHTISPGECANLIWRRRSTHWFNEYENIYEAINYASQFIAELGQADLRLETLADGIRKYQKTWYRLDQYYRKFIFHVRASKQTTLLQKLIDQVENLYTNNYLLTLNDNWQHIIDTSQLWDASPFARQDSFFDQYIQVFLKTKGKVAVIISDAFRYEVGEELTRRIEAENRYSAELEAILSMLPSYTQLGMAALLPHKEISIAENGTVFIDGQSTSGRDNRTKILDNVIKDGAIAIRSADLLNMTKDESRELAKQNQVIYIYHNQIDAVGDKMETEDRVFDAVESGMTELVEILKKLTNANLTNIIITSDHGFIYQNRPLQESEFASEDVEGDEVFIRNRRFVIGKNLTAGSNMKEFKPADLGLSGDYQVMIPKSINRLRLQGSGSRYVHGGASLQEVVIPVIKINKKKVDDISFVNVDIITSSSLMITSGQLSVAFYQTEPTSAKLQPRKLQAGIYSQDGTLISDPHELIFNLTSPDPREREVRVRFIMSRKADEVNNQTVYLKLVELIPGTSIPREYRSLPYQLRRSFTTDFDF